MNRDHLPIDGDEQTPGDVPAFVLENLVERIASLPEKKAYY